jgi:folate-dependent phosphoribosylglycinamide formyltransferase PurN
MSVLPRTFGVLTLDRPFHRALCGALLSSLERHGVEVSALVLVRPRRSIARILRRGGLRDTVVRLLARRILGSPGATGIPLDFANYSRVAGEAAVREDQKRLARFADEHGDRVITTDDLANPGCVAAVRRAGPSLIFAEGAGLLPQAVLDLFSIGVVNMHGAGPLPRYRGLGALEFALIDREPVTMNLHLIDAGIDTGSLLAQQVLTLSGREDLPEIYARLLRDSRDFIADTAKRVLDGTLTPVPQVADAGRQYFEPHPALAAYAERQFRRSLD